MLWFGSGVMFFLLTPVLSDAAFAQNIPFAEPDDVAGRRVQPQYDALGIGIGSMRAYPTVNVTSSFDSNVFARASDIESDLAVLLTPGLSVRYAQPGESFNLSGEATLRRYLTLSRQNDEQYKAEASATRELGRQSAVSASLGWSESSAARGTVENGLQIGDPLRRSDFRSSMVLSHRFNRVAISGSGSASRFSFGDVELDDGTVIDQGFRDGHRIATTVALSYDVSPLVALDVRAGYDWNRFDEERAPFNRDADGYFATVGVRYELTRLLYMQFGAGLRKYDFKNGFFDDISGVALNGAVRWYPTPLISLRVDLSQSTTTSVFNAISAVVVTNGKLGVDYELRRNLLIGIDADFSYEEYNGLDGSARVLGLAGRAIWKLNRWLSLSFRAGYDKRSSNTAVLPDFDGFRSGLTLRLAR